MAEIERFDLSVTYLPPSPELLVEPDPDGEWVRYADIAPLLEQKPLCAACAKPLEGTNWDVRGDGCAYHAGCQTKQPAPPEEKRSLGERAEQAASRVLRPGQERLT